MASLYYGKLAIVTVTATDAASGFPASNAALESLGRPWRAADTGDKDVVLDLGSSQAINALFLHDVNFASATIARSTDNVSYDPVGTLTTYAGRHGRRRGKVSLGGASARYVKISIASGTPTDAASAWKIGAAYLFASKVTPGAQPNYPTRVTTTRPRVSTTLANRVPAVATTGANIDRIELRVPRWNSEAADDYLQRPAAGTIVLDLEEPNYPEQQWPVRLLEEQISETFDLTTHSELASLPYTEIV